MAAPPDFIDRKTEIGLFQSMLAGNTLHSALAFLIKPRTGKTYLMKYLLAHCKQQRASAALVDFDNRQEAVVSYWKFIYRVCDALEWENFPEVRDCESRHYAAVPFMQFQAASGHGGVDIGEKSRLEDAKFERFSGRDQIEITTGDIVYIADQSEVRQERRMYEMGRAFQFGLSRMCSQKRVVLLLDTFECVTSETRGWLDDWVFDCVLDLYPNLIIIIAGRPELYGYLNQPKPWKAMLRIREIFDPPEEDDIREFARNQGITIPDHVIPYIAMYAGYKISMLSDIAKAHSRYSNG
jgi:hypothetical protein